MSTRLEWDHFVNAMAAVCICRYQPIALATRTVYIANLPVLLLSQECFPSPTQHQRINRNVFMYGVLELRYINILC